MSNPEYTAGEKIFKYQYHIRIPAVYANNPHDTAQWGTPTTGDREYDTELANYKRQTTRTIDEMVELSAKGVDIEFMDLTKPKEVNDILIEHLTDLANYINNSRLTAVVRPDEDERMRELMADIEKMYAFSVKIHPVAMALTPLHDPNSGLFQFMQSLSMSRLTAHPKTGFATTEDVALENQFETNLNSNALTQVRRWQSEV